MDVHLPKLLQNQTRFNHVIRDGPKYTNFLACGRGMSVD